MSSRPPCSVAQDEKQALPEKGKTIALHLIILPCVWFLGDAGGLQGEKEEQADQKHEGSLSDLFLHWVINSAVTTWEVLLV